MRKIMKNQLLEIARQALDMHAANLIASGKSPIEVDKFKKMTTDVISKGEGLSDDFFVGLSYDINEPIVKRGVSIIRAIQSYK